MITSADADRLRAVHAGKPAVLSVYLPVPVDLAEHRGLPIRARELIKAAASQEPRAGGGLVREADVDAIINSVTDDSHAWLGHTVALFAWAEGGLFEAVPLPGPMHEQAVIADRPYLRPMLAALQRNPAYRVALVDTQHAWILAITGDRIETVAERIDRGVRSPQFAGWYGLEAYRIQQRIMELSKQHFRDTISILAHSAEGADMPLVLGGHEAEISRFQALLPKAVRSTVTGSFRVDLQTATPGRVRELAGQVMAQWSRDCEARLVAELLNEPPNLTVTTDLDGCLAASRARAVAQLILPDDQVTPGYACDECGALSSTAKDCDCPDPDQSCHAVPDLLDELAACTLGAGGDVTAVRDAPFIAAARLRFPVTAVG